MADIDTALARNPSIENKNKTYIKIVLTETEEWTLYECPSETVPLESEEEAGEVQRDNERYKYLTEGKGRNRRLTTAETSTSDVLFKTRGVNTEQIKREDMATFVSNYDMFDTYEDLATQTTSLEARDETKIVITTYLKEGEADPCDLLIKNDNFRRSSMVLERICAGNVFREKQKRFRNMYTPDPLANSVNYKYRLDTLWAHELPSLRQKSVVSASWCDVNGDLLAIGYGKYYCTPGKSADPGGCVCIWNIKNPVNPERTYEYNVSVTAVFFSKENPQLLAIGLSNGRIEIRDIRHDQDEFVAKSDRHFDSPGFEPIWQIEWLSGGSNSLGQILTISQDGRIMKYNFTTGPFLRGFMLMRLNCVEGVVEGLPIAKSKKIIEGDRHPQALCVQIHPVKKEIYLVGTNEGCIHRCSINYTKNQHHSGVLQVHNGSVFSVEYSPWSPKIFLTCGSDWFIRIWIEGIFKPIVELSSGIGGINCAAWSPVHSTIIVCCTNEVVEIWDIRRRILKPVAVHKFPEIAAPITIIKFSKCGRSLMVGMANGSALMCALEEMPFSPNFQFKALESALHEALRADEKLLDQVKSMGNDLEY